MSEIDLDSREWFLNCIVTTAIEGGTGYWAVVHTYKPSDMGDGHAVIQQYDEGTGEPFGERFRLDGPAIEQAIAAILYGKVKTGKYTVQNIAWANATNDAGDIDADLADTITQAAMLGKITYG
jgi:hypothetical protein